MARPCFGMPPAVARPAPLTHTVRCRLDHAAPHSYHVATTSNDVAGIALLLSVASSMNTAVQRYTEGGAHGLSPNLMSVQWGLGTGRCEGPPRLIFSAKDPL
jgi:hypothetical protein